MTDGVCCEVSGAAVCPGNGRTCPPVPLRTLLHQLRRPWVRPPAAQDWFFCGDPDCAIVYFGGDGHVLLGKDLRGPVGQKMRSARRPVCYCFDIRAADLDTARGATRARAFVVAQTRAGACDCRVRNPSGRCCLKDFP